VFQEQNTLQRGLYNLKNLIICV